MKLDDGIVRAFACLVLGGFVLGRVQPTKGSRPYADVGYASTSSKGTPTIKTAKQTFSGPRSPSDIVSSQSAQEAGFRKSYKAEANKLASSRSVYRQEYERKGPEKVDRLNREWSADFVVKESNT